MPRFITLQQLALLTCITMQTNILLANNTQDPMRPPNFSQPRATATAPAWKVEEILISDERRVAIINDKPVTTGDSINGARVISINSSYVTLRYKNKTFKQYLSRIPVKQQTLPGTD